MGRRVGRSGGRGVGLVLVAFREDHRVSDQSQVMCEIFLDVSLRFQNGVSTFMIETDDECPWNG